MMMWWIAIGFLSRLIIHTPDATPITTLALLAPRFFSLRQSFLITLSTLMMSDLLLHILFHYAAFGSWSFFTYSGWCGVVLLGGISRVIDDAKKIILLTMGASFIFWMWTNFGTWCATTIYPHTISGFIACYYAALPFLRNSVIGAVCWSGAVLCLRVKIYASDSAKA